MHKISNSAYTRPITEKTSFLWVCDMFSVIKGEKQSPGDQSSIMSPTFSAVNGKCIWQLKIYPDFILENQSRILIYLKRTTKQPRKIRVSANLILMNSSDGKLQSFSCKNDDISDTLWGPYIDIEREAFLHKLTDNVLKIHASVTAFLSETTTSYTREYLPPTMPRTWSSLWESRKFSDFVIQVRGTEIPIHKCIMAAGSPVFEAMLRSQTTEIQLGRVVLDSWQPATVLAMVEFFYTGKVRDINMSLGLELLKAADMYDIADLLKECVEFLKLEVCSTNAFQLLLAAVNSNAYELKDYCKDFIYENRDIIEIDEECKKILEQRQDIAFELIAKVWNRKSLRGQSDC